MAIKVKNREEMKELEAFLKWIEDDLISVYELYCPVQAEEEDSDTIVDAIKSVAALRLGLETSSSPSTDGKLQKIRTKIALGDSDFDIAKEMHVSIETVRRVRRNS